MENADTDNFLWFIQTAKKLSALQLFDAAEDVYNCAANLFPDEKWIKYHRAHFYLGRGDDEKSLYFWTKYHDDYPDDFDAIIYLVKILLKKDESKGALNVLRQEILNKFPLNQRSPGLVRDIALYSGDYGLYFKLSSLLISKENFALLDVCAGEWSNYGRNLFESSFRVFMYWDGAASDNKSRGMWQFLFGKNFTIIGDAEVVKLLSELDPFWADVYSKISIPACKSDVARLVWSYHNGGLYVDAHCGVGSLESLKELSLQIGELDLVLFCFRRDAKVRIFNGIFYSKPKGMGIRSLMNVALTNLVAQYKKESIEGFKAYNIFSITGPHLFVRLVKDEVLSSSTCHDELLFVYFLDDSDTLNHPVVRYQFYGYRKSGFHWSDRQKSECLFIWTDTPAERQIGY
jgi:hypothetical protein